MCGACRFIDGWWKPFSSFESKETEIGWNVESNIDFFSVVFVAITFVVVAVVVVVFSIVFFYLRTIVLKKNPAKKVKVKVKVKCLCICVYYFGNVRLWFRFSFFFIQWVCSLFPYTFGLVEKFFFKSTENRPRVYTNTILNGIIWRLSTWLEILHTIHTLGRFTAEKLLQK